VRKEVFLDKIMPTCARGVPLTACGSAPQSPQYSTLLMLRPEFRVEPVPGAASAIPARGAERVAVTDKEGNNPAKLVATNLARLSAQRCTRASASAWTE
jgi:hypothetical protein